MNKTKGRDQRRIDHQGQIIQRKNSEIEALKGKVSKLEIDINTKNELISSIDSLRKEMSEVVADLKAKRDEYDKLMSEVIEMRKVICQELFGNEWRWKIVRWLMKR